MIKYSTYVIRAGIQVTLMERSDYLGANVLSWGHVKLFSPNNLNHSKTGLTVLEEMGVTAPEESNYPTGKEFVTGYLSHLGRYLEYNDKCRLMTFIFTIFFIQIFLFTNPHFIVNSVTQ